VVEDTGHLKLVGSVTERDMRGAGLLMTGALRKSGSERSSDPCLPFVVRARRLKKRAGKLHAHRVMSLPVADKAGGYL
jgi:CBS domain-containing protein